MSRSIAEQREIAVTDAGHPSDLGQLVFDLSRVAPKLGTDITKFWRSLEELDKWVRQKFFAEHLDRYKISRRKAPIYWQLATPSASYSVWLYIHAFTKDTLFRVQNDYVAPKFGHEGRRLKSLRSRLSSTTSR